jgi:hypothetical protein
MDSSNAPMGAPSQAQQVKQFIVTVRRVTYTNYLVSAKDEGHAEEVFFDAEYLELGAETIKMSFEHREITLAEAQQYRDIFGKKGGI